jgi:hypothetical protein
MFWMTSGVALLVGVGVAAVLILVVRRAGRIRELGSVSTSWVNAHRTDIAGQSE